MTGKNNITAEVRRTQKEKKKIALTEGCKVKARIKDYLLAIKRLHKSRTARIVRSVLGTLKSSG